MIPLDYFHRYEEQLRCLPLKREGERYSKEELCTDSLQLFVDQNLQTFYAPFHYFNPTAKVVLVGTCPGFTQMEEAMRAARHGLQRGLEGDALFEYVDKSASFSGPLRNNLVAMLDAIGLAEGLGLESADHLFKPGGTDAAFTSCISAPVFRKGNNYTGSSPKFLNVASLKDWAKRQLTSELRSARRAIVIPLGGVANAVVEHLEHEGLITLGGRCLREFPHPSGANGHRLNEFARGREAWTAQLKRQFSASTT
jgi:hypothetical protein